MRRYFLLPMLLAFVAPVWASSCELVVKSNDAMQYDVKEITVPETCKKYTVKLEHTGKFPKAAMGHNWVLTKEADFKSVAAAAASAGLAKDYVPDDPRIIAHTKLLGGGESDVVTFNVSKLTQDAGYIFFCSFPGHSGLMKGVLKLGK